MTCSTLPIITSATAAIRAIVGTTSVGHGDVGHAQPCDLRDVHREVTHPLELADHPQRGHEHPQVAGDRVLQREQLEAVLLQLLAQGVDLPVVGDDLLGPLGVALEQGGGSLGDGLTDQSGHRHELAADGIELVGIGITHEVQPRRVGERSATLRERQANSR